MVNAWLDYGSNSEPRNLRDRQRDVVDHDQPDFGQGNWPFVGISANANREGD
jgi:hypothetical protein